MKGGKKPTGTTSSAQPGCAGSSWEGGMDGCWNEMVFKVLPTQTMPGFYDLCFPKSFGKEIPYPIMLFACQMSNSRISISDQGTHGLSLTHIPPVLPLPALLTSANHLCSCQERFQLGFSAHHSTRSHPSACQAPSRGLST